MASHEERIESLDVDHQPPPCFAIAFALLESFHSRQTDCPVKQARLTWRETSHFIIAMAARSWIIEEEEESKEG